jgi:hypothetical protein
VRPYMWTVSGPRSSVPELGEGIDARWFTAAAFCPIARLSEAFCSQFGERRLGLLE